MRTLSLIAAFSTLVIGIGIGCSPANGTSDPSNDDSNYTDGNDGGGGSSTSSGGTKKDAGKSSSSSSSGGSSSGSSTSGGASSSSSSGGSSGTSSSGSSGSTPTDQDCAAKTTADECGQCCDQAHNNGADVGDKVYMDCMCNSPGACKTECANSLCAGSEPQQGDACDTCLGNDTACGQKADDACNASADCKAFEACMNTAGCDQKN
jgi:hypothetical protein